MSAPAYRVSGTRVHYEPSRGLRWLESFTTLVYAPNAQDAMVSVEKQTNDTDDTDCFGLAAVRVGEVPA